MPDPTDKNQSPVGDLEILDVEKLSFFRHGAVVRLTVEGDRSYTRVTLARAFPLSHPDRFVSVLDGEDKEIGVVATIAELESESAGLVEEELERRYIVPVILRVVSMNERFGIVEWEVETDRGERKFITRNLRDNVVQPSTDRYLLVDVDDNRYDVPDINNLDDTSQNLLMQHL